jgi:CBS domain-containing protein
MKHIPQLVTVMTPFPHHIIASASLAEAERLMYEYGIRHLPVMENDDIVGILSDRDIKRATALGHAAGAEKDLLVSDLCSFNPHIADVGDPLDIVLDIMVEKKLDAILVLKEGELAGILTAIDGCKLLAKTLRQIVVHSTPGNDAA